MNLVFKLTAAGLDALIAAGNDGFAERTVVSLGVTGDTIAPGAPVSNEIKRIGQDGGQVMGGDAGDGVLHITAIDPSADAYTVRGLGLYLSNGVLLGSYGQAGAIAVKTENTHLMLSFDLVNEDGGADLSVLEFGDTNFFNPPSTTAMPGVVELATATEVQAGIDNARAVTPAGLSARTATETRTGLLELATAAEVQAGIDAARAVTPATLAPLLAALSNAVGLKAPLASAALTGTPTAPTAVSGTNTNQIATTAFVVASVAALVNSSPAALDTLAELASALGNDANFSTTMTNALAQRVRFLPLATVRALASNGGPIIIEELAGEAWKWTTFGPYFTGYASPYCGEPRYGVDVTPRAHEIDAIGGIFNKAAYPELWGWAQWRGLVKSQAEFDSGLGSYWFVADPGGDATKFRAPNLLGPNNWGMFLRMAAGGVDADTANARALGSAQKGSMAVIETGGAGSTVIRSPASTSAAARAEVGLERDAAVAAIPISTTSTGSINTMSSNYPDTEVAFGRVRVDNAAFFPRIHV
ncbi:hypothetical protein P3G55_22490 [Leptospira sp. 96542]|nr:hypothetical protein [Leptospira sp. 96542]